MNKRDFVTLYLLLAKAIRPEVSDTQALIAEAVEAWELLQNDKRLD